MSIGYWDVEPVDVSSSPASLPTSPVYGSTTGGGVGGGSAGETPELILEYWSPKGQKEKVGVAC